MLPSRLARTWNLDSLVRDTHTPRFKAVLFDFGGTLDADGIPSVGQFLHAYRLAGGYRTADEFETIFRESDRQLAEHPAIRTFGFRDTVAAQSRLLAALVSNNEQLDPTRIAATIYDDVRGAVTRNRHVLQALKASGIRSAVVSNFTGNLASWLAELDLASVIDLVIDSAVVGVRKPDPAIFRLALEQLHVLPAQALMVGDNPFADIRAAAEIGMATCWLAPLARPVPVGCTPTFRIARLSDLLAQLEVAPVGALVVPCTG